MSGPKNGLVHKIARTRDLLLPRNKRKVLQNELFESLSRTVTCTRELSAFICVIPRGMDLIPPCLDYSI